MRFSNVARVVRPVLVAAVPALLAACSSDPMSPTAAPKSRISSSVSETTDAPSKGGGGSVPWYRTGAASTSTSSEVTGSGGGGSVPWYRSSTTDTAGTASKGGGGSVPWY